MSKAAETYEDAFRRVYARQCAWLGLNTREKQEKAFGYGKETLKRHLDDPNLFRRKQLMRIYKVLQFTPEERDLLNNTGRIRLC